jgi:hypothetical protein
MSDQDGGSLHVKDLASRFMPDSVLAITSEEFQSRASIAAKLWLRLHTAKRSLMVGHGRGQSLNSFGGQ